MNVIYSVKDYVTNVFDLHQGTGSGAVDVVAVQHEDGALHVHFGKHKVREYDSWGEDDAELTPSVVCDAMQLKAGRVDKQVVLEVNGARVPSVRMKVELSVCAHIPPASC